MTPSLKARSLRSWIVIAMMSALAPVVLSGSLGFWLLHRYAIEPINDVAFRQREQIAPVQNLRVLIGNAIVPVDEYLEETKPLHVEAYRKIRGEVEREFASLIGSTKDVPSADALVERARQTWTDADAIATGLISTIPEPASPEIVSAVEQYHGLIAATSDRLEAAYRQLAARIGQDHDAAILAYERSIWIAGIAAMISIVAVVSGVMIIGRVLSASVDRLVEGAARFAEGDRNHRIAVAIPPELNRVAEEFNSMIRRIDESEKALAELAHVDSLTGISNRRAFDGSFAEVFAHKARTGRPACLLAIDLDHFKRINDTWGHPAGDQVLRAASKAMSANLRPGDRLFRMGGEEFSVLLQNTSLEEAKDLAERLRSTLAATKVSTAAGVISFTASIGIATLSGAAGRELVLAAADAALYLAKSEGRNRVVAETDHRSVSLTA